MEILRIDGPDSSAARGITVVIDVIRAFSVAAHAFNRGATRLLLVHDIENAFALREHVPEALLAGERGGRQIPGFDLNNSPALMARAEVAGRSIIQCTGAGTKGAVTAVHADALLVCSLLTARATAEYVKRMAEERSLPVTLVATALPPIYDDIEDRICGDYIEALLRERLDGRAALDRGLRALQASNRLSEFTATDSDFPAEDVPAFMEVDCFDFIMTGERKQWEHVVYVEVHRLDP